MKLKVLDLFSGLGGFSQAFRQRGHHVTTVDIEEKFRPDICRDILDTDELLEKLTVEGGYRPDVILASPPCEEFSKARMPWYKNIHPDMSLFSATLAIVVKLDPRFWVIENVQGAIPFFSQYVGKYKKHCGSRYLWGEFPKFCCTHKKCYGKEKMGPRPDRKELRAIVPYEISINLCLAIEKSPRIEPAMESGDVRRIKMPG